MTLRTLASLLALTLTTSRAPADDWAAFLAEYGPHHDKITAHLWRNVKVEAVRKQHEYLHLGLGRGPYLFTERVSAVAGADRMLYRVTQFDIAQHWRFPSPPPVGTVYESGGVVTPDMAYTLDKTDGKFSPPERVYHPWGKHGPESYYASYGSWGAGLGWPLYDAYIERGPNRYRPSGGTDRTYRTVTHGTHRGQEVMTVRSVTTSVNYPAPIVAVVHLRKPDYIVIGRERVYDSKHGVQARETVTIDYGPPQPDTGLPFPTRVRGRYTGLPFQTVVRGMTIDAAKPDAVSEDVTFTEYRRYMPTADELDPVKQFGVAVPAGETRPPLPTDAEWAEMLRPPAPPPVVAPPARWQYPELRAGLVLFGCVALAAVAYRRFRV